MTAPLPSVPLEPDPHSISMRVKLPVRRPVAKVDSAAVAPLTELPAIEPAKPRAPVVALRR